MKKENDFPFYCISRNSQIQQKCENCSLKNRDRDCMGFPILWSKEAKEEAFSYLPFNLYITKLEEKGI